MSTTVRGSIGPIVAVVLFAVGMCAAVIRDIRASRPVVEEEVLAQYRLPPATSNEFVNVPRDTKFVARHAEPAEEADSSDDAPNLRAADWVALSTTVRLAHALRIVRSFGSTRPYVKQRDGNRLAVLFAIGLNVCIEQAVRTEGALDVTASFVDYAAMCVLTIDWESMARTDLATQGTTRA